MSDVDKQKLNEKALPFFIRFLEDQDYQELSEEESSSIRGGCNVGKITTMKYPSDNEDVGGGGLVTLKYPSDNEDVGGGGLVTLKYPSDNEDAYTPTL